MKILGRPSSSPPSFVRRGVMKRRWVKIVLVAALVALNSALNYVVPLIWEKPTQCKIPKSQVAIWVSQAVATLKKGF